MKPIPFYPLPSNEKYEKFLQSQKKELCTIILTIDYQTQYSMPFLLSLRSKFSEKPKQMAEVKLPYKNEIRSRAKIITEEAFRETRNYLNIHQEVKNPQSRDFLNNLYKKIAIKSKEKKAISDATVSDTIIKTTELREILNKISLENFDIYLTQILKYNYDEELLENFKVKIS